MDVTRWMVAGKVPRRRQQEDNVRRLFWEAVPRGGDEVRGGSSVPCKRVPEWKRFETESGRVEQMRGLSMEHGLARPRNPMNISSRTRWE